MKKELNHTAIKYIRTLSRREKETRAKKEYLEILKDMKKKKKIVINQ